MEVKRHESGSKVVGTYLSIRLARKREMESKEKIRGGGEGEEKGDRVSRLHPISSHESLRIRRRF